VGAYVFAGKADLLSPESDGVRVIDDNIFSEVSGPEHHLLFHSDVEGYYWDCREVCVSADP
jgi:hypothetical protein